MLIVYAKGLNLNSIIQSSFLFVPLGNDYYGIGSTYDWIDINNTLSTDDARQKLTSVLDSIIKIPYSIISQKAGIRPSTLDRRALVGLHPEYKNMYILNGLGTRGVLLAPYLSNCLVESIYSGDSIYTEVDINRFN